MTKEHNPEALRLTSRDRISHLEDNVAALWTAVRIMDTKSGLPSNIQEDLPGPTPQAQDADSGSESEGLQWSPTNAPSHLRQLFDNNLVGSREVDGVESLATDSGRSGSGASRARKALQRLIPCRQDCLIIGEYATTWLTVYNALFSAIGLCRSAEELIAQHNRMLDPHVRTTTLAAFLVSIAITVQHVPMQSLTRPLTDIKDAQLYVREVSRVVEETVVSNDSIAASLDGIETTLLFVRLQLINAKVTKCWIYLRRVMALAELIGLPRAAQRVHIGPSDEPADSRFKEGIALWQEICVVDRITSVMFGLPLGTSSHPFATSGTVISPDGEVVPKAYMCNLADIAAQVLEMDEMHSSNRPDGELFERALKIDQELRSLSNMTPARWWSPPTTGLSANQLLQYWHRYFTVRAHLHLAMKNDDSGHYAYSHLACTQASRELVQSYVTLRTLLPAGFFAGRIIDLQALTAAIYLVNTCSRPDGLGSRPPTYDTPPAGTLLQDLLHVMDKVATQAGGDFAREAAIAIRSLSELLRSPDSAAPRDLRLRIPLLGQVQVRRKEGGAATYTTQYQAPLVQHVVSSPAVVQQADQGTSFLTSSIDPTNALSWSMDFGGSFPFLDGAIDMDQWLSFTDTGMPP